MARTHPDRADPAGRVQVLVVDDHEVVRAGLAGALGQDDRYQVVALAANGREALELARRDQPDVAVVDLRLPDLTGIELCRQLRTAVPATSVILLSSYLAEDTVREAMAAGAAAYVTKSAGLHELRRALDEVSGPSDEPRSVSQIVRRMEELSETRAATDAPTPAQTRVLELLAQGLTYAEVARRLVISEATVRFHVQRLKVKLGTSSRTELVVRAVRAGFIVVPEDEAGR
jgi:DNA-binding NarL/FixJ family response regulator